MRIPAGYLWLGMMLIDLSGCILDPGEARRPEILPGRYQAESGSETAIYDFHSDGTFVFKRFESGLLTYTEEGMWSYRYVDPETRYLDEIEVTRKNLVAQVTSDTLKVAKFSYAIAASSKEEFVIKPSLPDGLGIFVIFVLIADTNVHFHRI